MEDSAREAIRAVVIEDPGAPPLDPVLAHEPDIDLRTAPTLADGLDEVARARPDVVLVHVTPDEPDVAGAVRAVTRRCPDCSVVVLAPDNGVEVVARAVEAGAVGFVVPGDDAAELLDAVRRVARGAIVLPPGVVRHIAGYLRRPPEMGDPGLTAREREVLQLLAAGRSVGAIANELGLSMHTVRNHIRALRRKLGARSQVEAVAIAYRRRLVQPPVD